MPFTDDEHVIRGSRTACSWPANGHILIFARESLSYLGMFCRRLLILQVYAGVWLWKKLPISRKSFIYSRSENFRTSDKWQLEIFGVWVKLILYIFIYNINLKLFQRIFRFCADPVVSCLLSHHRAECDSTAGVCMYTWLWKRTPDFSEVLYLFQKHAF